VSARNASGQPPNGGDRTNNQAHRSLEARSLLQTPNPSRLFDLDWTRISVLKVAREPFGAIRHLYLCGFERDHNG
jgi:hypothetical protein